MGGGVAALLGRMALFGAGAHQSFGHHRRRENPQPCPSPLEGEGF